MVRKGIFYLLIKYFTIKWNFIDRSFTENALIEKSSSLVRIFIINRFVCVCVCVYVWYWGLNSEP
jgi:hypothetical protein